MPDAQPTLAAESEDAPEETEPAPPVVAQVDEDALTNRIVEAGKAALEEMLSRTVSPAGPVTIDGSVTQGNRVVPASFVVHSDPLKIMTDRLRDHYHKLLPVISTLEATLNELKTLSNQIGIGL